MELIKELNLDAYTAGKAFDAGLAPERTLDGCIENREEPSIKARHPATICEIVKLRYFSNDQSKPALTYAITSSIEQPVLIAYC